MEQKLHNARLPVQLAVHFKTPRVLKFPANFKEALLIDNGEYLTILIGHKTSNEFLYDIFGAQDY